jgi:hypothetical protein
MPPTLLGGNPTVAEAVTGGAGPHLSRENEAEARQAKVLTADEALRIAMNIARRIATNIARLPELLGKAKPG